MIKEKVTIRTITPNEDFGGDVLPSMTFKELVGEDPIFKENQNILSEEDLRDLDSTNMDYTIF